METIHQNFLNEAVKENSDENGYPISEISLANILMKIECSTANDIIEIVEVIEAVNSHNIQAYINQSMTNKEAIRHADNLLNHVSKGTSAFIRLKRMAAGL